MQQIVIYAKSKRLSAWWQVAFFTICQNDNKMVVTVHSFSIHSYNFDKIDFQEGLFASVGTQTAFFAVLCTITHATKCERALTGNDFIKVVASAQSPLNSNKWSFESVYDKCKYLKGSFYFAIIKQWNLVIFGKRVIKHLYW